MHFEKNEKQISPGTEQSIDPSLSYYLDLISELLAELIDYLTDDVEAYFILNQLHTSIKELYETLVERAESNE